MAHRDATVGPGGTPKQQRTTNAPIHNDDDDDDILSGYEVS